MNERNLRKGTEMESRAMDEYQSEVDPTPYCNGCGAMRQADCHCGPLADND